MIKITLFTEDKAYSFDYENIDDVALRVTSLSTHPSTFMNVSKDPVIFIRVGDVRRFEVKGVPYEVLQAAVQRQFDEPELHHDSYVAGRA